MILCWLAAAVVATAQAPAVSMQGETDQAPVEAAESDDDALEVAAGQDDAERAAKRADRRTRRKEKKAAAESEEPDPAESAAETADGVADEGESVDEADEATDVEERAEVVPCVPSPSRAAKAEDPEDRADADESDTEDADESADDESDNDESDGDDGDEGEDDAPEEPEPPEPEEECDPERPALLVFSTDSESTIFVDGTVRGRLEPGDTLEVRVGLGEIELRALSRIALGAAWEKTIELEEPELREINVRMERTIRKFRQEERKSGVFADRKTSLMWPKRDSARDVDLRGAYAYCRDLETAGFEDWRLPTLDELRTLEAIWLRASYKVLGGIVLSECCVWTSDYDGTSRAKTFNFRYREEFDTNAGYQLGFRALCVREWDPEAEDAARAERAARAAEESDKADKKKRKEDAADGD